MEDPVKPVIDAIARRLAEQAQRPFDRDEFRSAFQAVADEAARRDVNITEDDLAGLVREHQPHALDDAKTAQLLDELVSIWESLAEEATAKMRYRTAGP